MLCFGPQILMSWGMSGPRCQEVWSNKNRFGLKLFVSVFWIFKSRGLGLVCALNPASYILAHRFF